MIEPGFPNLCKRDVILPIKGSETIHYNLSFIIFIHILLNIH